MLSVVTHTHIFSMYVLFPANQCASLNIHLINLFVYGLCRNGGTVHERRCIETGGLQTCVSHHAVRRLQCQTLRENPNQTYSTGKEECTYCDLHIFLPLFDECDYDRCTILKQEVKNKMQMNALNLNPDYCHSDADAF